MSLANEEGATGLEREGSEPPDVEPAPDAHRLSPAPSVRSLRRPPPRPRAKLALTLAGAAAVLVACTHAQAARMIVVQSGDMPRLVQTLAKLRDGAGMPVEVIRLPSARDEALDAALSRAERGVVVVALGPRASDYVAGSGTPLPTVHCLAGADALRAGLPAVPSEAPADQQVAWLAKLVPSARSIGLLFDPAINTRRAEALAAALSVAGLRPRLQPVASPAALPTALDSVVGRVDVLLAIPDGTVYTRESARGILLFSFRNGIPLVGPNDAWVRMGGLYALDWDYDEVGRTCAELAARELAPSKLPPPPPPRPRVSVNMKSASQFRLNWDPMLLRAVDQRHE